MIFCTLIKFLCLYKCVWMVWVFVFRLIIHSVLQLPLLTACFHQIILHKPLILSIKYKFYKSCKYTQNTNHLKITDILYLYDPIKTILRKVLHYLCDGSNFLILQEYRAQVLRNSGVSHFRRIINIVNQFEPNLYRKIKIKKVKQEWFRVPV